MQGSSRRGTRGSWAIAAMLAASMALTTFDGIAAPSDRDATTKSLATADDFRVRAAAAMKLGASGDKSARPALEAALDDVHPTVRQAAAGALARLGDPAAMAALKVRGNKETNPPTKAAIDAAVASLKATASGIPTSTVTASAGAPSDWAQVKYVVVVQKVTNTTGVRGDALVPVLDAATRARFAGIQGVFVVPSGGGASAIVATASGKGLPVLSVDAGVEALDQSTSGADLKVHAKVSFALSRLSSVKASLDGSASSVGSPSAAKSPASLAKLQDLAIDGAVASAMAKAPGALKAAAGG